MSNQNQLPPTYSPRASLAALGLKLAELDLFAPIRKLVTIQQKTVKYSPDQKLYSAFVNILAGGKRLVEVNKLVRADPLLQRTFSGISAAEQSGVQKTLDACNETNVNQMYEALQQIFRTYSQAYRHDYHQNWQLLDIDMTGAPCGRKAAMATKGFFSGLRHNQRGRQMGRVLATHYQEIVVDRLYAGTVQLNTALPDLVGAAEKILAFDAYKRYRTICRVDAGGGTLKDVNWLLDRGYQVHCKDYSSQRATVLAKSVKEWVADPLHSDREVGWVTLATTEYVCPIRRIALRFKKGNDHWNYAVIISSLPTWAILELTGEPFEVASDQLVVALAFAHFYDQRGGGVETEFKEDKDGLGLTSRNKKSFSGQEMLMLLGTLAHNVLIWAREWLKVVVPKLQRYGLKRLVRDLLTISGFGYWANEKQIGTIVLNQTDPYSKTMAQALAGLLAGQAVAVEVGQT